MCQIYSHGRLLSVNFVRQKLIGRFIVITGGVGGAGPFLSGKVSELRCRGDGRVWRVPIIKLLATRPAETDSNTRKTIIRIAA